MGLTVAGSYTFVDEIEQEEDEQYQVCRRIWNAALYQYIEDCRASFHDRQVHCVDDDDEELRDEALSDLTGTRSILRHFCDHLGLDEDRVAVSIADEIEQPRKLLVSGRRAVHPIPARPKRRPQPRP